MKQNSFKKSKKTWENKAIIGREHCYPDIIHISNISFHFSAIITLNKPKKIKQK